MELGEWAWSMEQRQVCRTIEAHTFWGETTCRVWLPGTDSMVRIPASRLKSLESAGTGSSDDIVYVAAAARVADSITHDVLIAPIESSVIPLPHQIRALARAISNDRVRYLFADEVGLGKTIEAGLIMRELKLRGLVKRTLVVAPKGLVTQWVAEIRTHQEGMARDREKGERAFQSRKRIIEKIGLPAVRRHRLLELEKEEQEWKKELERQVEVSPEMFALVVVEVRSERKNG
jgi:hypothetical protein